MDSKFIKLLIEEGPLLVEHQQALKIVTDCIQEAFIKTGLHRRMIPEQFAQEVNINAALLLKDISEDKKFRNLRAKELNYCFSNGLKGRLGTDKDIDLTYKSLVRWIEGYMGHEERKLALRQYYDEHRPKPKELPAPPFDMVKSMKECYAEYVAYLKEKEEHQKKVEEYRKKGWRLPKDDGIKTIGQIGGLPIIFRDFGLCRIKYLREKGIAQESETLVNVFDRLYKSGGENALDNLL